MMKKSFINKAVKAFALTCALVTVLSCKNGVEPEQIEPEAKNATVSLKVHNLEEYTNAQNSVNAERTVNPVIELDKLTDFVFSGAKTGADTQNVLASFSTLANMPSKIEVPYEATEQQWTFTLTAKKGSSVISGSTSKTLQKGDNELEFAVSLKSYGNGAGNFAINVDFSADENCDRITRAEAYIENRDGTSVSGFNKVTFGKTSSYSNSINSDYTFTYVGENLPKGIYRAVIKLYAEDVLIGYWQDLINISDSLTSSADAFIDKLNNAYNVTYHIYRNGEAADLSLDFEPVYVVSALETELPEPARANHVFMGWYADYNLTTPVVLPFTQDTDVYAYWESLIPPADGSYYPAKAETVYNVITGITAGSATSPANIRVVGKITYGTLSNICQAISNHYNDSNNNTIFYNIDLSRTSGLTAIPSSAFYGCNNLAGFVIPDGVTEIGDDAFEGCTSLTEIEIPDGVTKIGNYAFESCESLTKIEIPDSVTEIGLSAFAYCDSLEDIYLGSGVSGIDNITILYASPVKTIRLSENNQNYKLENGVLYSKDGKNLIAYPTSSNSVTEFVIPSGVETVEPAAFYNADYLTEITIPDSVTCIDNAFGDCSNLETVSIGSGVESVTRDDFEFCTKLATINISSENPYYYVSSTDGVLYSADGKILALYPNANTRTTFTVPDSVEVIYYPTLRDAVNLTQVILPSGTNNSAAWYYGSSIYFSNTNYILQNCTRMNISNYSQNCATLKNWYNLGCIKINNLQAALDEFFGNPLEPTTVYKAENTVVANTTEPYTFVDTGTSYTFCKIETEVGSTYYVNYVDTCTWSNYTLPEDYKDWNLTDCYIAVFANDGIRILEKQDDPTLVSFVATTPETYIGLLGRSSGAKCAIRVWAQIVKTGFAVEVKSSEVDVTVTDCVAEDGYICFETSGNYSSYKWYVDGYLNQDVTGNTFNFHVRYYDGGVHLITLEVEKDGLYYSYSAQVFVKKSNGAHA